MKKFLQRGETYSFFNLKNIVAGVLSAILAMFVFWSFLLLSYTGDMLLFTVFLVVFLIPVLFMIKKHGWKSGLSTLIFGILFLIPAIIWFANAVINSIDIL